MSKEYAGYIDQDGVPRFGHWVDGIFVELEPVPEPRKRHHLLWAALTLIALGFGGMVVVELKRDPVADCHAHWAPLDKDAARECENGLRAMGEIK